MSLHFTSLGEASDLALKLLEVTTLLALVRIKIPPLRHAYETISYQFPGWGYNTSDKSPKPDPLDGLGHGTHVSGIIAGQADRLVGSLKAVDGCFVANSAQLCRSSA